jgi:hypothetical protein
VYILSRNTTPLIIAEVTPRDNCGRRRPTAAPVHPSRPNLLAAAADAPTTGHRCCGAACTPRAFLHSNIPTPLASSPLPSDPAAPVDVGPVYKATLDIPRLRLPHTQTAMSMRRARRMVGYSGPPMGDFSSDAAQHGKGGGSAGFFGLGAAGGIGLWSLVAALFSRGNSSDTIKLLLYGILIEVGRRAFTWLSERVFVRECSFPLVKNGVI